jgi:sialic acid synthase SpsE/sugar phosphate isomerase/epimerase
MSIQKKSQLMFPFSKDKVMFIQHDLENVLVGHDVNIEKCAGLLKKNPAIIVVNDRNELLGTITNGDIRRLVEGGKFQHKMAVTAGDACNSSPILAHIEDSVETLTHLLSSILGLLPLVDSNKIVKAVAYLGKPYFQIGDTRISVENNEVYTIAEIGVNHNGSIEIAKELIQAAQTAGFSAVKLQIRSDEYFTTSDFNSLDLGAQYIKKEIKRTYIDFEGNAELIQYAKELGVDMICTPFDDLSLDFCIKNNVDGLKIASCDLINTPLLKKAATTALPLIVSTGMSWEREIVHAYGQIVAYTSNFALLHCNSTYPCPAHDVNLNYIERMNDLTSCIVGYSSHDSDPLVSALAIAKGARIIEVHITHDKHQMGTDHKASIPIVDLKSFITTLRNASEYLGNPFPRSPSQGEILNRLSLSKSLCLAHDLKAKTTLSKGDLILRSPGNGIPYNQISMIIGRVLKNDMLKGEMLRKEDVGIDDNEYLPEKLNAAITILEKKGLVTGIPVRYHDFESLRHEVPVRFLEFHMSDSDLKLNPEGLVKEELAYSHLFVHAVEQYSDGFIINFASSDAEIVAESKLRFRKLIQHVDSLKKQYSSLEHCSLILNLGGFSSRKIEQEDELKKLHKNAVKNLLEIKAVAEDNGVEILLQTMPLMPWHQGGVAYHNLMVMPDSINYLSVNTGLKVCFDISHSYLAAYDAGMDMNVFTEQIKETITYLHISDASRLSQEGLQVSEGDVDLTGIIVTLLKHQKEFFYIPEIWNGHANSGEGFKIAILRLSELV